MKKSGKEILIKPDTVLMFDMDGTLIDTNLANFLAYKKAINSVIDHNKEFRWDTRKRFNRSILKSTFLNLTDKEYDKIIAEKEKCYRDFLNKTTLISNTADILFKYYRTNTTVLVTNCRKERALSSLDYFGLTEKFSKVFFREFETLEKKVNKFQKAITVLGVSPKTVIAFEDEEAEIVDAINEGIEIINPKIVLS